MRQIEAVLKAAADPTRTRVLKLLEARELCVCQIQAVLGLAPSTVSKHLAVLKTAGLVDDRRQGRWIHYALASGGHNPYSGGLLSFLRAALHRDPRIRQDRRRLKEVLKVPAEELCAATAARLAPAGSPPSRRAAPKGRPHG